MLKFRIWIILGSVGCFCAERAQGATYTVVDLTPPGMTDAWGLGISPDGKQQTGAISGSSVLQDAAMWNGTAGSAVDLAVANLSVSVASGSYGMQEVGYAVARSTGASTSHAFLWTGSTESGMDLNPPGADYSVAKATNGLQQGGYVGDDAYLWNGTATGGVDLNPAGFQLSLVVTMNATQQGGWGIVAGDPTHRGHALLWEGTAESAIDMQPPGYTASVIAAMSSTEQGGAGYLADGSMHALIWSGSAASAVDLNPDGFTDSVINGMTDGIEVGYGSGAGTGGNNHALLWDGNGVLDLQSLLPVGFVSSQANGVDMSGDVIGEATDAAGHSHAILWAVDVPEPGTLAVGAVGTLICLLRRGKRRRG